jgi:hypothetical protein
MGAKTSTIVKEALDHPDSEEKAAAAFDKLSEGTGFLDAERWDRFCDILLENDPRCEGVDSSLVAEYKTQLYKKVLKTGDLPSFKDFLSRQLPLIEKGGPVILNVNVGKEKAIPVCTAIQAAIDEVFAKKSSPLWEPYFDLPDAMWMGDAYGKRRNVRTEPAIGAIITFSNNSEGGFRTFESHTIFQATAFRLWLEPETTPSMLQTFSTPLAGAPSNCDLWVAGDAFDDRTVILEHPDAVISRIQVIRNPFEVGVEGIQVWYRDPTSAQPEEEITAGCHWVERESRNDNLKKDELVLADGEFIVQVVMKYNTQLNRIDFKTNLGQELRAGDNSTDGSEVEIPDGHRLRSFYGRIEPPSTNVFGKPARQRVQRLGFLSTRVVESDAAEKKAEE